MQLSAAAEFAIRGTLVLAGRYGQGPVPLGEVCRLRDLAKDYMTKIFGTLARAGIIRAIRGKGGGYELARPPGQIAVLEVIEAIEGPLALNLCQHDPPRCEEVNCPLRPVWTELQEKVRSTLSRVTLDQFPRDEQLPGGEPRAADP